MTRFKTLKKSNVGVPIVVVIQDPRSSLSENLLGLGVYARISAGDDSQEMALEISNALLGRKCVSPVLKKMLFDSLCHSRWKNSKG